MPLDTVLRNGTRIGERGKYVKPKRANGISHEKYAMEIQGHPKATRILCLYKVFNTEQILKFLDRVHPNHQCTKYNPKKTQIIKIWLKYGDPFDETKNPQIIKEVKSFSWKQKFFLCGEVFLLPSSMTQSVEERNKHITFLPELQLNSAAKPWLSYDVVVQQELEQTRKNAKLIKFSFHNNWST